MIDPANVCLFIPAGLKKFKLNLFERIGRHIEATGGRIVRHDVLALAVLPREIIPVIGCQPESTALIAKWKSEKRNFIYWDRGYARRVFATWLPKADTIESSYYRWHLNSFQMRTIVDVRDDRWGALKTPLVPWCKMGRHVVVACPTPTYEKFHAIEGWTERTLREMARLTDRQIVVRDKESKRPLQADLEGAHCLVAHGSIAAVESVILGCPVIVHSDSAAALVGRTDLKDIERPVFPERSAWLRSLAYCQFNERELVDGTLWRLIG